MSITSLMGLLAVGTMLNVAVLANYAILYTTSANVTMNL